MTRGKLDLTRAAAGWFLRSETRPSTCHTQKPYMTRTCHTQTPYMTRTCHTDTLHDQDLPHTDTLHDHLTWPGPATHRHLTWPAPATHRHLTWPAPASHIHLTWPDLPHRHLYMTTDQHLPHNQATHLLLRVTYTLGHYYTWLEMGQTSIGIFLSRARFRRRGCFTMAYPWPILQIAFSLTNKSRKKLYLIHEKNKFPRTESQDFRPPVGG